ncbi:Sex-determining fem-1 [Fusarium mundagurra]|uniref:Sex-determining fem-1 n=1 Tax=Fusarium mundagurra TaxID=1567541 RepID=A0A8H5YM71_9HYPO|nr:Sex-determining fem-1 [Fusarium mundagurra]
MDQVRKKDAIEAEWLRNYQLIRNLYLSDMSLNDLVYWLGIFENFTVTKSQLEYRLKKWNISKNIDRDSWRYIDQTINKRKREGKESDVLLCGKRVKQSTIEKETNRHRDERIPAQTLAESIVQSIASSDQLIICTPQAYQNEFEWPETLPWFKFRSKLQEWLSYTQLYRVTSEQRGPLLYLLTSKILLVGHRFDQCQANHLVPKLAMSLVLGMLEYFPGEHLQTAQIIATGTASVMIPECLKLIFYKISNNMDLTWEADDFENLYTLIRRTGLLSATDSLRRARQQDLTIRAFMDNLFRGLIKFIYYNKTVVNKENPKTLVKWLLTLGQDPNIEFLQSVFREAALDHAILSRQVDIIEPLLNAGASLGAGWGGSNPRSIMSLALADRIYDNKGAHIIRLLRLFEQALEIGADISLPIETLTADKFSSRESHVVKEETALSTAAAVSIDATSRVFDLLQNQNQVVEAASFITPDVFISAACAGNANVISFLHEINPIGFECNARGVTPLEVAIKQGHQEAYRLLFQLYRQSSATLLLISICTDQLNILQYLLGNGLDVNLTAKRADIDACRFLVPNTVPHWSLYLYDVYDEQKPPTVLELFLSDTPVIDDWKGGIKLLIRSRALFPAEAILDLSSAGHDDILPAALDAGGDPNVQDRYGYSALAFALRSKNTNCVQLLLERGAKLHTFTPEIFEAFVPDHIRNIQGERGGCDPGLRALFLEYWANLFDPSKDSLCDIDAAIIAQHDSRLKSAFSELPTYYSPSSLCSAVLVENHWVIDFLLKNRSLQAPHDILEGTAVGLAAVLGNLPLVRKLIAQLQKPETALLPFSATHSSGFLFSELKGLSITSSHTFWHRHSNNARDCGGVYTLSKGSPLALAASYRGAAGVLELLGHGYQPDDITWARTFSMNTLDCLKALMDHNMRVRSLQLPLSTLSPLLRYVIRHDMEEAIVWLIESGADINENDVFESMGRSPVQLAIENGYLTIAETLLQSGAKVNVAPSFFYGVTALQCAATRGHIGLAKQLLDAGARVNARGSRLGGRTALKGAAERGRLDMVELLLYHGALTTGPGRFQFIRAIRLAEREGHNATAALLRQSREWTDEDTHTYNSMCFSCDYYFSEPKPRGKLCDACDGGYTRGRYCCDEIHMPEDDCYHCYTEDEESHWNLKIHQREELI